METAVQIQSNQTSALDSPRSVQQVMQQIKLIQDIMRECMKEDEHYGTIPGTNKKSLWQPGAEKLGFCFRLRPEYINDREDLPNGHREYTSTCVLYTIGSNIEIGRASANCSTMEPKYRYTGGEKIPTEQKVPTEYWNLKNAGKIDEAKELIGGPGFGTVKVDGTWVVAEIGEKQERTDISEVYNTVLQMAQKRAFVRCVRCSTAASDIFTQDVDEDDEGMIHTKGKTPTGKKPVTMPVAETASPPAADGIMTVTGTIEDVSSKPGKKKDGTEFTRFGIKVAGVYYNTFDTVQGALAQTLKGRPAMIAYKTNEKGYHDIVSLATPETAKPAAPPPSSFPQSDTGEVPPDMLPLK